MSTTYTRPPDVPESVWNLFGEEGKRRLAESYTEHLSNLEHARSETKSADAPKPKPFKIPMDEVPEADVPKAATEAKEESELKASEPVALDNEHFFPDLENGIAAFNRGFAYIMDPGMVITLAPDFFAMTPRAFAEHHYANYWFKGDDEKQHKLASAWIADARRRQFSALVYAPGQPRFPHNRVNCWPGWGVKPAKDDMSLWHQLMDYFFLDAPEARRYFEQWLAWQIQHPGDKLYTALVLRSQQTGVGKNLVCELLINVFGKNGIIVKEDDIHGRFNKWQQFKQLIVGDEVYNGDPLKAANNLKSMITAETIGIEDKFKPRFYIKDTVNYIFLTNHLDAFHLVDEDRRFWIWDIKAEQPLPDIFYEKFARWKNTSGPAALLYYLQHLDLTGFSPHARAPMTEAKKEMIELSRSELESWVMDLTDNIQSIVENSENLLYLGITGEITLFTCEQLLDLWREGPGKTSKSGKTAMAKALANRGFKRAYGGEPVRLSPTTTKRLWVIALPEKAAPLLAIKDNGTLAAEYSRQRCSVHNGTGYGECKCWRPE